MIIRFAQEKDLSEVNRLRRQVNLVHVEGRPETFKPGFSKEMEEHLYAIFQDPEQKVVVAKGEENTLLGFAVLHHICKPENPVVFERRHLEVDEFCVDDAARRQGVGTSLIEFIRNYAREQGYQRIELNMWEFNKGALAFYEAVGFTTYRRFMEMKI